MMNTTSTSTSSTTHAEETTHHPVDILQRSSCSRTLSLPYCPSSECTMSFLTIPSEEGLVKWVEDQDAEEEEEEEEDEDDGSGEVSFSLRSSPVPRRRGHSILDENAEYMRIHSSLPGVAKRRAWFADTAGGDLLDVREFVAFASDEDEEEDPGFEAEAACYRKHPTAQPIYRINTDLRVPAERSALLEAVQAHKVAVEQLTPVEGEPLAFGGLVRVLNISYHKSVYIRSTMDHWDTYYDHPAEYIQGSSDGQTDAFGFKLSFAPPYNTHGTRIEFVVRYETSDGDYWANNSNMNYAVTLLVSYEDDRVSQVNTDTRHNKLRGILKAPKVHSVDNDGEQLMDEEELSSAPDPSQPARPTPVCPTIIHPQIDLETADDPFDPPLPLDRELSSLTDDPRCDDASRPRQSPCTTSPRNTTDPDPPSHVRTSPVCPTHQSSESRSSPSLLLPCEPDDQQISERSAFRPHATPSPTPSPCSLAEGAAQGEESTDLVKLRPLTAPRPSVHVSSREIDEEEMLRLTLGDRKIKVAQIFSRGEKDVLNEKIEHPLEIETVGGGGDVSSITHDNNNTSSTKEHFDPEFNESPENMDGRLRSFETLAHLNDLGVPDVPSAPRTLSPTASVTFNEQPSRTPSTVQHLGPFETSMSSKVEDVDTARAHSSRVSERLELMSTESEIEEEVSVEGSREGRSDHSHDKEQKTKKYEEQETSGDVMAAFSENGEMVHRGTTARPDIGKNTNGEESLAHQRSTDTTDRPFRIQFGTSVKTIYKPYSEPTATQTQTSPVDTDVIFSDVVDNPTETRSRRPEEESTDLVSSDAWFTPTDAESPPSFESFLAVELATSTGLSPLCAPKVESITATADVIHADNTLAAHGGGDTSREAVETLRSHAERRRYFRLSVVLLFGIVSVAVVMKEPGSLFYLGFFLAALFFLMTSD